MDEVFDPGTHVELQGTTQCLDVFTDGSFDRTTGAGGWAFVVMQKGSLFHEEGGELLGHSNNSLELVAVAQAVEWLQHSAPGAVSTVWTDSAYVIEGCCRWRAVWRNNGWKRMNPRPWTRRRTIPDAVIWKKIDGLLHRRPNVTMTLCKGHAGNSGNDKADLLAKRWMSRSQQE